MSVLLRVIGLSHVLLVCSTWARKEAGRYCRRIDMRIVFADAAIYYLFLHCLKLLTKPRAAISSEIRSYTFLLRRIRSKLALYFDISSNVNNGGDFVVRPIYVYWFFRFAVVGIDASAAEAILSSSELVTRLRSRLAIPGCIAPGSVTVVAYRFERFRV